MPFDIDCYVNPPNKFHDSLFAFKMDVLFMAVWSQVVVLLYSLFSNQVLGEHGTKMARS
jgi:hypothetical protein